MRSEIAHLRDENASLLAQIAILRTQVERLEREKRALLAAASDRDYERPPHY